MRLLVITDSHGYTRNIRELLTLHAEADIVVHLGDCERDIEMFEGGFGEAKKLVKVCGNCDFGSDLPCNELIIAGGKKILCTHGHCEKVKFGLELLHEKAQSIKADIVLYGHTHEKVIEYEEGVYYFNPGALCDGRYGMVDITENGVACIDASLY